MNKHIELVKKWLANPESVSQKELQDNYNSAQELWEGFYSTEQKNLIGITNSDYDVQVSNAAYGAMTDNSDWANYWINQIEAGI
tara:strand:- start:78 stop:329 length:252 start_codon:yes stop_codon:yes gene_type:complete